MSDETIYLADLSARMDKMAEVKEMSEAIHKQNRLNLFEYRFHTSFNHLDKGQGH